MARKSFVLTKEIYKSLLGRGKIKKCYLCGKEFKIGEKIKSVSNRGRRAGQISRWVCIKCSRKYNIW
ncbi:MAG: hypothetical protein ACKD6O_08035 [Candidatus Bathyarchaeota archaeon]